MRTYNYLEVQQNLSSILNLALTQEVIVKEKNGRRFKIMPVNGVADRSPFEVSGINTVISTSEMMDFLRESRTC
jgi:hypothetical protein